eukprot:128478-Amphidinium_carterae.1
MAATNSTVASAASPTPRPRPTVAPLSPESEMLPPPAVSVHSSGSEVQDIPNLALMSAAAAFDLLHSDFICLSPRQVATWWKHDYMTSVYK